MANYISKRVACWKKGGSYCVYTVRRACEQWLSILIFGSMLFHGRVERGKENKRNSYYIPVSPPCLPYFSLSRWSNPPFFFYYCVTYLYDTNNKSLLIHISAEKCKFSGWRKCSAIFQLSRRLFVELYTRTHTQILWFELYITKY